MSNPNKVITVLRAENGEIVLRVPNVTERKNGSLWMDNEVPLVNQKASGMSKEDLTRLIQAGKFSEVPDAAFLRVGVEINGVIAYWEKDAEPIIDAARAREVAAHEAALEAAIPGLAEIRKLRYQVLADQERYSSQFERMMEDADNDGARPPQPVDRSAEERLKEMLTANPRAALWIKLDSDIRYGPGAQKMLEAGASTEEVEAKYNADVDAWVQRHIWD